MAVDAHITSPPKPLKRLADISDLVSEIGDLLSTTDLALKGYQTGDDPEMMSMRMTIAIALRKTNKTIRWLDAHWKAAARRPEAVQAADTKPSREPRDFYERLSDLRTRTLTIELALGCIDDEKSIGQIGDVRRQVTLADTELGEILCELDKSDEARASGGAHV
jgi:hypothetical protein